jgi:hypothetical protein
LISRRPSCSGPRDLVSERRGETTGVPAPTCNDTCLVTWSYEATT